MAEAWREHGQTEIAGSAHNPRIIAMFEQIGHPDLGDETAWCAAFVGACLERSGISSTRSLLARSYLGWGAASTPPAIGSIVVLPRGNDPTQGHVGFLVGMTDDHVHLLGGNQSNAVNVARFDRNLALAYREPAVSGTVSVTDANFDTALKHVLAMEGGWTDDPYDPGGPTNKGITLAVFARERGIDVTSQTLPDLKSALRAIPDALVRDIYQKRYWHPAHCPSLRTPLALMHFDASVNHGVTAAARILQEALLVETDGEIGPITLAAARKASLPTLLARYADIRRARYRALPHFWRFGRGWLRRADATLAAASRLISSSASADSGPPSIMENPFMTGPSDAPVAKPADPTEPKAWWSSMTIVGTLLTALTTVLPMLGVVLGVSITPDLAERLGQDIVLLVQAIGGLVGTLMALLGGSRAIALMQRNRK
jgi:uncharacterized protein (TIGR02594 family)